MSRKKLSQKHTKLLKGGVSTINGLQDEVSSLTARIRNEYKRLKAGGLDEKAVKAVVVRSRKDRGQVNLFDMTVEDYEDALGLDQETLPEPGPTDHIAATEARLEDDAEDAEDVGEGELVDEDEMPNGDDAIPATPAPGYRDKTERMTADQARRYFTGAPDELE